jgi:hypothetical protein
MTASTFFTVHLLESCFAKQFSCQPLPQCKMAAKRGNSQASSEATGRKSAEIAASCPKMGQHAHKKHQTVVA